MTSCDSYRRDSPATDFNVSFPGNPKADEKLGKELQALVLEASLLADTSSLLANVDVVANEVAAILDCPDCSPFVANMCYEDPNMMFPEDVHGLRAEAAAPNLSP